MRLMNDEAIESKDELVEGLIVRMMLVISSWFSGDSEGGDKQYK